MPLKAHALVTLATIKILLNIKVSTYDALYETLINMVSRMMIQEIGHNPVYTSYPNISLDGTGRARLLIPHFPIVSVSSLAENDVELTENTQFLISPDDGVILRISGGLTVGFPKANWAEGNRNIVISYIAGYSHVRINSIYFDSGSEVPVIGTILIGASSAARGTVSGTVHSSGKWDVDTAEGRVEFSSVTGTFTDNELVNVNGGTANIMTVNRPSTTFWMPDDIQMACAKQVGIEKKRFGAEDWDQTAKTFPDGSEAKSIIELHPQVKEVCRQYRRQTL